MAEHVQEALDRMVAPLRDLLDRQIFTEKEIKAIVTRRRESEYLLRRLTARKADFLRYIQAEQGLERLRQLRTKQRHRDHLKSQTTSENKQEQHIGDAHIVQHIHLLFVRAIRKFRSDLSLHLLHAEFCKQTKSFSRLGRVYAEALQIFPRQSGLWVEAASNEFFGPNRSIRNARILLQRGLRFNKASEELWCQSFSLELHYAQTLRGRKQILLGGKMVAEEIAESASYNIAEVIYKNAIQAIPDSMAFRLRLLDTCRNFPDTETLMEMIQSPLERDFGSRPEAWIARALFEAEKNIKQDDREEGGSDDEFSTGRSKKVRTSDTVVEILNKAIKRLPNNEMYLQAFGFARNYEKELAHKGRQAAEVEKFLRDLVQCISGHSSPDLALEHADYLVENGKTAEAETVLQEFCTKHKPCEASVWIQWAGIASGFSESLSILSQGLDHIPMSNSKEHMKVLLQYFGCQLTSKMQNQALFELFQRILLLAPSASELVLDDIGASERFGLHSVIEACIKYLEYASALGPKIIRKVYSAVLFNSSMSANEVNSKELKHFIEECIRLEANDRICRRRIYDRAVQLFEDTNEEQYFRHRRNDDVC